MEQQIMREMDELEHDKKNGFYDKELDMFFIHLDEWLDFKWNKTFSEIM